MLARMIDKVWDCKDTYHPGSDTLYIDRNGDRFQYILDFMRDGQVHLPVTESNAALQKELEYYGFQNIKEQSITQGTLEGGRVLTNTTRNVDEEIDTINAKIKTLEKQIKEHKTHKQSIRAAHKIFLQAANLEDSDHVTIHFSEEDDKKTIKDGADDRHKLFCERLEMYGLKLVSYSVPPYYETDKDAVVEVQRIKNYKP